MASVKQLFYVFTNKKLFIEWLLSVNIAIGKRLVKIKSIIEADYFAENNDSLDLRKVPQSIKNNLIHDENVLKMRWDICLGCEFFKDSGRCSKCGCFMKVKTQFIHASCPVGKWGKYKKEEFNGITATS